MATQKDVADRAGVSMITVSRVINNRGNVKEKTRERIETAIKELDYYPNRQAQALHYGLLHTIAFVTPNMAERALYDNYYIAQLLSGVVDKGRRRGWDVLLTTDFVDAAPFDFLRVWHQKKVDGLVFVGLVSFSEEQIAEIKNRKIPCVSISERTTDISIPWVDTDNFQAAWGATNLLLDKGHRHFAYIGELEQRGYNPNFADRRAGVIAALEQARSQGLAVSLEMLPTVGDDPEMDRPIVERYLQINPRPTAIISANDVHALWFMDAVSEHGIQSPEDFSIIGFDAEPAGRNHRPSLASFAQPLLDMGRYSVDLLLDQVTDGVAPAPSRVFPLRFQEGSSIGPVSGGENGEEDR